MSPRNLRRRYAVAVGMVTTALLLTACTADDGGSGGGGQSLDEDPVRGEVVFATTSSDMVANGEFAGWAEEFNADHPDAWIKVEVLTEAELVERWVSDDRPDVWALPRSLVTTELAERLEPIGRTRALSAQWRLLGGASVDGVQYALPVGGTVAGIVYNTDLFAEAGVTETPSTSAELLTALIAVGEQTEAVPLYLGAPNADHLGQWSRVLALGDADELTPLVADQGSSPWSSGSALARADTFLSDAAVLGLTEDTSDRRDLDRVVSDLATGRIAAVATDSSVADRARAEAGDDIALLPFATALSETGIGAESDTVVVEAAETLGIDAASAVKPAARAWMDFLLTRTTWADDRHLASSSAGAPHSGVLAELEERGVEIGEAAPLAPETTLRLAAIQSEAGIDLRSGAYRQRLVDLARGVERGTPASYLVALSEEWADARARVVGEADDRAAGAAGSSEGDDVGPDDAGLSPEPGQEPASGDPPRGTP